MAENLRVIDKRFICPGDALCTTIHGLTNLSGKAITGVQVRFTIPEGVEYNSSNISQGTFSTLSNTWEVGSMMKNQTVFGEVCWTVTDDCEAPFKFEMFATSSEGVVCIDSKTDTACVEFTGLTPCDVSYFEPVKIVYQDYDAKLSDSAIGVNAGGLPVTITLPDPITVYDSIKQKGTVWYITALDLTNAITIDAGDFKIVDNSTVADALSTYSFSVVGSTKAIQSFGTFYKVRGV